MSVLIEHMEMPKNCYQCQFRKPLNGGIFCTVERHCVSNPKERPVWCPIKDATGKLADVEKLCKIWNNDEEVMQSIMEATI